MIRAANIRVPLDFDFSQLRDFCSKKLRIPQQKLKSAVLAKKSVDARKKSDVHFIISVDIEAEGEEKLLQILKNAPVSADQYEVEFAPIDTGKPSCSSRIRTCRDVCGTCAFDVRSKADSPGAWR